MKFEQILEIIRERCGDDIVRAVENNETKLKEADIEIDAGLSEVGALKAKIAEMEIIKVENAVLKKNAGSIDKKIAELFERESKVKKAEEINALKISNAEDKVKIVMDLAKILSGKEATGGSTGKKSK